MGEREEEEVVWGRGLEEGDWRGRKKGWCEVG